MSVKSFKWTWNPVLLLFDTIKTNVYAAHVLLCAEHNRRGSDGTGQTPLTPTDPDYLTPMKPKKFYIMLGRKMMSYKGANGYWFERPADRKRGRDDAAQARGARGTGNAMSRFAHCAFLLHLHAGPFSEAKHCAGDNRPAIASSESSESIERFGR